MPKRTNEFQRLVALIEKSVEREGAKVTESKELLDKITGHKREVDIVIETTDGVHHFTAGVECTDRSRAASVTWVEQMYGKHLSLPTDKLILVSRSGFSAQALKKAAWLGIDALSLSQAQQIDWDSVVRKIDEITVVSFLIPYVVNITVVFALESNEEEPALEQFDLPNLILYDNKNLNTKVTEFVNQCLYTPNILKKIEELAFTDSGTNIEFDVPLVEGVFVLDKSGSQHKVHAIRGIAKCRKEVSKVSLEQGSYKNLAVAHGSGTTFGRIAQVVIAQQPNSRAMLNFSIEKSGA